MLKLFSFSLLIIISISASYSQDTIPISIQRLPEPIILDGLSNETAWSGINSFTPVMQQPVFGREPNEKTEILVAYDDNYLYVAGRLYDREPDKIQVNALKRDEAKQSSDWFGIVLDTYNDNENGVAFFTTPSGLRTDCSIVEGPGGIFWNMDWNTFWDVATTRNNEGWFAEFRIPFSSLRFNVQDGSVTMAFISWRLIPRNNEWIIYPSIPNNWSMSVFKVSRGQLIRFSGIRRKNPVYVSPYILVGWEESCRLNNEGNAYTIDPARKYEAGLDIKYGITSNLTADATINTDFSQVEIDDQVISLERYSVYMPEKRQFFLERFRNFDFAFNDYNTVFYSRKIGIAGDQPVRIYGGGRLVGRIGKTDIGLLDMQTAAVDSIQSANVAVLRLKRQVFNDNSYIGCVATTKAGTDGTYNIVYGLDGVIKVAGDDYLKLALAQCVDSKNSPGFASFDAMRYRIEMERRSIDNFSYALGTSFVGRDYNPELGFENWHNYRDANLKLSYCWLATDSARIYRTTASIKPKVIWNNSDGRIEGWSLVPSLFFVTKAGLELTFSGNVIFEQVRNPLTYLGNIDIPIGDYTFYYGTLLLNTPYINPFQLMLNVNTGSFYDGLKTSVTIQPTWDISRHFQLKGSYQLDKISVSNRDIASTSHLARLNVLAIYSTRLSLATLVQYSNIEKLSVSNIRFRYNPREGNDLYIVYSHGFNTERSDLDPEPPVTNCWNISIKYVHTFIF